MSEKEILPKFTGNLPEISVFVLENFNTDAEDYVTELFRIHDAIKEKYSLLKLRLDKRYCLLYLVFEFRNILSRAGLHRRIGYLYEALLLAFLNGKTKATLTQLSIWALEAKNKGFLNCDTKKMKDAYEKSSKRPGFELQPLQQTVSRTESVIEAVLCILNEKSEIRAQRMA